MLPHDIQEKLHFSEKEYFKNHSAAIKSYIAEMDIDLTVVWCFFYFLCFTRDERFIRLLIPFITGHGSSQGSLHSGSGAGGHWRSISWWPFCIIDQELTPFPKAHRCWTIYITGLLSVSLWCPSFTISLVIIWCWTYYRVLWKNFWSRDHIWIYGVQ